MKKFREKYIGSRAFYAGVLALIMPMIIQNLITNFVSMLDNIMVGQIGTAQMSGVSIVNQFVFIYNITTFGAISGPGIFGSQFWGKGDHKGHKHTFVFRLIIAAVIGLAFALAFYAFDTELISIYLAKGDNPYMRAETLEYGRQYMRVIILTIPAFVLSQVYSSVIRECGETMLPMLSSFAAVGVNLILDYGLIFGKLSMPKLGVVGAAYATVAAKLVEALVVVIWAHLNVEKNKYLKDLNKDIMIPGSLLKDMTIKGFPLLANEFLWVIGMSAIAQCYSARGLEVVAARNIASTITNLFGVFYVQLGAGIGLIIGARLGAGKLKEAREESNKLMFFSVMSGVVICVCLIPIAYVFPSIYNTEVQVMKLATYITIVQAIASPVWSYTNACYFVLRSGGRTGITFLFDFVFTWVVMIPCAYFLSYHTGVSVHMLIAIVTYSEIIKVVIGYLMVRSDIWVRTIVS